MGFISNLFGGSGGDAGANIQNPVQPGQLSTAYNQQQNALAQQQAFVNALGGVNGIGNQQNVYNQLQGVANGTGPNPAQAMLNNSTGQNVQQQAALMASQRGVGANPGLLARQAALQGGAIQQNAAGQGAALQAQQSLGALGQLGNLANAQVGQQAQGLGALNSASLQGQQNLLGSQGQYNSAQAGLASQTSGQQGGLLGGLLGGVGSAIGSFTGGNPIGAITGLFGGGGGGSFSSGNGGGGDFNLGAGTSNPENFQSGFTPYQIGKAEGGEIGSGPKSNVGKVLKSGGHVPGKANIAGNSYSNDNVKALLSPGEIVLPRSVTKSGDPVGNAAKFVAAVMAKKGMGGKK